MSSIIGIVGGRRWGDQAEQVQELVINFVNALQPDTIIVSGGADGVDTWAEEAALARKLPQPKIFKPDYQKHGRKAPFVRNTQIVRASTHIVAFWDGKSTGTMDTIKKAREMGKQLTIINPDTNLELFRRFSKAYPRAEHGINGLEVSVKRIMLLFRDQESLDKFSLESFEEVPIIKDVGRLVTF